MLYTVLKREGLKETWRRFCFRCCKINTFYVFSLDLSDPLPDIPAPEHSNLKEIDFPELELLRGNNPDFTSEFYRDQIGNEERCFLALLHDKPAFILWISSQPSSGFITVDKGSVEMNHIYCLPQFRANHLCTATISFMAGQVKDEGCKTIRIVTHEDNIALIKCISRCGFKRTGHTLRRWAFLKWPTVIYFQSLNSRKGE